MKSTVGPRSTVVAALVALSCTPPSGGATGAPAIVAATPAVRPDSGEIPAGFGRLKQDEIAIKLDLTNVMLQLLPTEESVIRVLAPDSYAIVHKLAADKRPDIERVARQNALGERHTWMATYSGLAAGATYIPGDVTITQNGREYRPLGVFPLTQGFGGRLQANESQRAVYLFDDGLNVSQPLTLAVGTVRSSDWERILRAIDQEKAVIRARGGKL